MSATMQIRRGLEANLPSTAPSGELLFTTDTDKLFIGTGTGIIQVGGSGFSGQTIGFNTTSGTSANDVGNIQSARRSGSVSQCSLTVTSSDVSIDLVFDIQQNGISVFITPPTIPHGSLRGQKFNFPLRLPILPVVNKDNFNMNINSGTSSWKFSVYLE